MKNLGLIIKEKDLIQQVVILNGSEKVVMYNKDGERVGSIYGDKVNKIEIHFIHSYATHKLIDIDLYVNNRYIESYYKIKGYNITNWL